MFKGGNNNSGSAAIIFVIVFGIILVASMTSIISLEYAEVKFRDIRRITETNLIKQSLDTYFDSYGSFPDPDCTKFLCNSIKSPNFWIPQLVSQTGIILPNDPVNISADNTNLVYIFTRNFTSSLDPEDYYYIIFHLEDQEQIDQCNGNNPYTGWSCIGGGLMP